MTPRVCIQLGAILAGLAVAMGAFGAHSLRSRFDDQVPAQRRMLENWETAAHYQMSHALGLLLLGALAGAGRLNGARAVAAWAFVVGIILFSGSLYALVLTGQRGLGAITPIGGVAFLVGWVALAVGWRRPGNTD